QRLELVEPVERDRRRRDLAGDPRACERLQHVVDGGEDARAEARLLEHFLPALLLEHLGVDLDREIAEVRSAHDRREAILPIDDATFDADVDADTRADADRDGRAAPRSAPAVRAARRPRTDDAEREAAAEGRATGVRDGSRLLEHHLLPRGRRRRVRAPLARA